MTLSILILNWVSVALLACVIVLSIKLRKVCLEFQQLQLKLNDQVIERLRRLEAGAARAMHYLE